MLFELIALQLLSHTFNPGSSEVLCYIQGIGNESQISASIDSNGIGYVSKDVNNYTFQAVIANGKIDTLKISNNSNDDEKNVDMLAAANADVSLKDADSGKMIDFSCGIKSDKATSYKLVQK